MPKVVSGLRVISGKFLQNYKQLECNFRILFKTQKRSFICAFSIYTALPLIKYSGLWFYHRIHAVGLLESKRMVCESLVPIIKNQSTKKHFFAPDQKGAKKFERSIEPVAQRCSAKKMFFKTSQNSLEHLYLSLFFNKVADLRPKWESSTGFFCEFGEIHLKHLFFRTYENGCFWMWMYKHVIKIKKLIDNDIKHTHLRNVNISINRAEDSDF